MKPEIGEPAFPLEQKEYKQAKTKRDWQSKICWLNTLILREKPTGLRLSHLASAKRICREKITELEHGG